MVADVVEWILANRSNQAFTGWTQEQIALRVCNGIDSNLFLYSVTEDGNLSGVCLLQRLEPFKLHVSQLLLSPSEGLLTPFIVCFKQRWPNEKFLTMDRRGKRREYRVSELYKKLVL